MNLRKVKVHVILAFVGVAFSVTVQCRPRSTRRWSRWLRRTPGNGRSSRTATGRSELPFSHPLAGKKTLQLTRDSPILATIHTALYNIVLLFSVQEAVLTLFQQRRYPTLAQDLHLLNDKLGYDSMHSSSLLLLLCVCVCCAVNFLGLR